jgi:hypothetical protein
MSNQYQNRGSYSNGYSGGYRNNAPQNSGYHQERPVKKHSGATKGTDKNGKQYFRGWNFSKRRGMITVFITTFKSSGEHRSEKGNVYTNLMAKVVYKDSGVEKLMGALLSHSTGRVVIPELGMVLNTAAPNGGYFGTFTRKK